MRNFSPPEVFIKTMRRSLKPILVASICTTLLGMSPSPASAAHANHKPTPICAPGQPRHSHLIAANTHAQVYAAPETPASPERIAYFGCLYGRKPYLLGGPEFGSAELAGDTRLFTLNGPIVAYEESTTAYLYPGERNENLILVRNLYTGHILHVLPTGTASTTPEHGSIGIGPVQAIVAKPDGAVAWIVKVVEKPIRQGPETYQVHAVDKTGNRVLASSTTIDPHSLALAGSTIYWTQNGKPESAILH